MQIQFVILEDSSWWCCGELQPRMWPALYKVATAAAPPEPGACEGTSTRRLCN